MIRVTDEPTSDNVKRHYLELREGADVDSALRVYCQHAHFGSYTAAATARRLKMREYGIMDSDIIEIAFRR